MARLVRESPQNVVIVDVRQHDYTVGKIRGSINIPFDRFPEPAIGELVNIVQTVKPKMIVTHCHYCQTRGPKSARMLRESGGFSVPIVYLEGGWDAWYGRFNDDQFMIEQL